MKKILIITMAILVSLNMGFMNQLSFADSNEVNIAIDGQKVEFEDVNPFVEGGRTLIPVRAVSEKLGAEVGWIAETQTVTVDLNNIHVELKIGSNEVWVDGEKQIIDSEAKIVDGRTVVPLRFVSESLGYKVEWFGATRTVSITSDGITDQLQLVRENDGSVKFENLQSEELESKSDYITKTSGGTVTFRGDTVAKIDESHFPIDMERCIFEGVWIIPEYDLFVIKATPTITEGYFGDGDISCVVTLKDGTRRTYKTPSSFDKEDLPGRPLYSNNFNNVATWEDRSFENNETFTTVFSTQFWPGYPIEDAVKVAFMVDGSNGYVVELNVADIPVIK